MPILFCMVARRTSVLAEYSASQGNANTVSRAILEKLPLNTDTRVSYSQDSHMFHVLCSGGLTYLCMADDAFGRRTPFAFLEEVQRRFTAAYGAGALTALAYAYNTEFARVLHQQCDYFSSSAGGSSDPLGKARIELTEVKAAMVQNIDMVLDRGEKIELLVDKTEGLAGDAFRFKRQSTSLGRTMWLRNMKSTVLLTCAGLLIAYFVVGMICGFSLTWCVATPARGGGR